MTITAKIIIGDGGIAGYNEWSVVYDAIAQPTYKTHAGLEVGQPEPRIVWHTPSDAAPVPVFATDENKLWRFTMDVTAATADAVLNAVAVLKRALNGATSQAMRATMGGGENKVRIALKLSGATYTTYYDVIVGTIDDSMAYYVPEALVNTMARRVSFYLTTGPYGYGDSFALSNRLASSPHMLEDSNDDGLADGLTLLSTPTCTIDTAYHLIGGKSQKVVTDAVNEGIIAAYSASGSIGDTAAIKGYVNINTAAKTVTCQLRNGGATTIATVSVPAGATRTIIGPDGDDWYEFNLSGTATTTSGWQIYVFAPDSGVTFYVDGLYLATGTLTSVPAFSSKRNLYNRLDPAIAATNINYLDTWGIPGDAPALLKMTMQPTAGKATQYIVGAYADGKSRANDVTHYHDSSEYTSLSGTWANGTGTINNNYKQCSTTGGVLAVSGSSEVQKISNIYARQPWRVFALAYTSDITATIQMRYYSGSSTVAGVFVAQTAVGSLTETSKWQLVDLGTLNLVDLLSEDVDFNLSEEIHITQASSQTLRIDGVFYMPTQSGFNISKHYDLASAAYKGIIYDGHTDQTYDAAEGIRLTSNGRLPTLTPGPVMNRLVFIVLDGADTELDITSVFPVDLEVTPRTSHLLGVA